MGTVADSGEVLGTHANTRSKQGLLCQVQRRLASVIVVTV